jgi:hypothetical protein
VRCASAEKATSTESRMECLASHSLNYTPGRTGARRTARPADAREPLGPSLQGFKSPSQDGPSLCPSFGKAESAPAPLEEISHGDVNIIGPASVLGSPSRHRTTDISQDERTTDLEFGYPIEYNGWFSGLYMDQNGPGFSLDRAIPPTVSRQLSYPSRRLGPCIARLKWQSPKCG